MLLVLSLLFHLCISLPTKICLFGVTKRKRDKETFYLLIHSPNVQNTQGLAKLKPAACNSESPTCVIGVQVLGPSFSAFLGTLSNNSIRSRACGNESSIHVIYGRCRLWLNSVCRSGNSWEFVYLYMKHWHFSPILFP